MKTINTMVYEFDELSDKAKDKAREWYRNGALDYDWWDSVYEDAGQIGLKITGFDLDRSRGATGHFTKTAEDVCALILAKHGETCETLKTAKEWEADVTRAGADADKYVDACDEFERALLEDYSIMLQHEYDYLLSNEQVDESIRLNGYTFTGEGKRFG